jgi:hypothetical protein
MGSLWRDLWNVPEVKRKDVKSKIKKSTFYLFLTVFFSKGFQLEIKWNTSLKAVFS